MENTPEKKMILNATEESFKEKEAQVSQGSTSGQGLSRLGNSGYQGSCRDG